MEGNSLYVIRQFIIRCTVMNRNSGLVGKKGIRRWLTNGSENASHFSLYWPLILTR